jgi:hydroxymethylbilane synthase
MARAMAETVKNIILARAPSLDLSVLPFVAEGDRIKGSLQSFGGKGTFIKDLERRLLAGEIDCAVHSLKDIPGDLPPHDDLALISFLTREDPRDALVMRVGCNENDLRKEGGVIGSSAPRREAALRTLYPRAQIKLCRGNVNSRLQKLDDGEYDAIVLSYAGLLRMNFEERANHIYSHEEILPAVGQGIITLQVRKADIEKCPYLKQISDSKAEIAARVERALLFRMQGNCHSAIAGHCSFLPEGKVQMCGIVYNPKTGALLKASRVAEISPTVETLGGLVADDLFAQGARELMVA